MIAGFRPLGRPAPGHPMHGLQRARSHRENRGRPLGGGHADGFRDWGEGSAPSAAPWDGLPRVPLPDAVLEREETRALVGATLSSLTPEYRAALLARYVEGRSVSEVAE